MLKNSKPQKDSLVARAYILSFGQLSVFALIFASVGGLVIWKSGAAPHNPAKSTGSLALVMVSDKNGDGLPNYGDIISFNTSTSESYPYVAVTCYQSSILVYSQTAGFYSSYPYTKDYSLGPTQTWKGGSARCSANMFTNSAHGKQTTLASLYFSVNP